MEALFRLLPGPQPLLIRYGTTIALVLLAFSVRVSMGEGTGRYGFIHFILPVVISALLFDRGTGFFALALSAVLVGSVVPWVGHESANISAILVFAIVGSCLVFIAEGLHRALDTAHAAQRATDLLLQEMSHRVKNKFSMIASIIALQARASTPDVKDALAEVSTRIQIIATVHDYLQLSRHDGLIDMSDYLPGLAKALHGALCGPRPIAMTTNAVATDLGSEKALALGVIVNELVTNAFKYSFPDDRPGRIAVDLKRQDRDLVLTVADDGVGMADDRKPGLGTRLVTVFAGQLGGTARWDAAPNGGSVATVQFPA